MTSIEKSDRNENVRPRKVAPNRNVVVSGKLISRDNPRNVIVEWNMGLLGRHRFHR